MAEIHYLRGPQPESPEELSFRLLEAPPERREQLLLSYARDDQALAFELRCFVRTAGAMATLFPGLDLGDFVMLEELAGGIHARTWVAWKKDSAQRVMLKLFTRRAEPWIAPVLENALRVAELPGEAVVKTLGVLAPSDMTPPGIVMELPVDEELHVVRSLKDEPPATLQDALSVLAQLARAVAGLHAHGSTHSNLTPESVLRVGRERIKLTDFALCTAPASAAEYQRVPFHEVLRQGGTQLLGNPAYLPPERLRAQNGPETDKARGGGVLTDLYAIGMIARELLTGVPAFAPRPGAIDAFKDVIEQVLAGDLPPLQSVRARFPLPAQLVQLVERCLARDPEERLDSAERLAEELEHLSDALSPTDSSSQRQTPALVGNIGRQRWLGCQRWLVAAACVLTLGFMSSRHDGTSLLGPQTWLASLTSGNLGFPNHAGGSIPERELETLEDLKRMTELDHALLKHLAEATVRERTTPEQPAKTVSQQPGPRRGTTASPPAREGTKRESVAMAMTRREAKEREDKLLRYVKEALAERDEHIRALEQRLQEEHGKQMREDEKRQLASDQQLTALAAKHERNDKGLGDMGTKDQEQEAGALPRSILMSGPRVKGTLGTLLPRPEKPLGKTAAFYIIEDGTHHGSASSFAALRAAQITDVDQAMAQFGSIELAPTCTSMR